MSQIKSKKRVAERGEVFTAEREVNAMCDLVANECLRPDSRFLGPACGDGNFLAVILKRKLAEQARLKEQDAKQQESKAKSIKNKQEQPKDKPNKKSKP